MNGPAPRYAEVTDATATMVTVRDSTGQLHFYPRGSIGCPRNAAIGLLGTVTYHANGSLGLWWFQPELPLSARQTFLSRAAMIAALYNSELYRNHPMWFRVEKERVLLSLDSPHPICVGGLDRDGWWLALPALDEFESFLRTLYGLG